MTSTGDELDVHKPWIKKMSVKRPGVPYYFNLETFERSWTHPTLKSPQKGESSAKRAGIVAEANPCIKRKKNVKEKEEKEEEVEVVVKYKEAKATKSEWQDDDDDEYLKKRKRIRTGEYDIKGVKDKGKTTDSLTETNTSTVNIDTSTSKSHKVSSVETIKETQSHSKKMPVDVEDASKSAVKYKPVDLTDGERKPIRFCLNSPPKPKKQGDTKDKKSGLDTKFSVSASIQLFQKLAKTVKWSKSSSPPKKKENFEKVWDNFKTKKSAATSEKPIEDCNKKPSNIEKEGKHSQSRVADSKLLKHFRIPKVNKIEQVKSKPLKSVIPICYEISDEEDDATEAEHLVINKPSVSQKVEHLVPAVNKPTVSPKIEHLIVNKPSVSEKVKSLVSVGLNRSLDRPIHDTAETPICTGMFKKRKKSIKQTKPFFEEVSKTEEYLDEKEENSSENIQNEEVKYQVPNERNSITEDAVEDMEVEVKEIINEITSFRGNFSHCVNSERDQHYVDVDWSTHAVYYVSDTNVLLHDVNFLQRLKMERVEGKSIVIVIPYIVLQELDGLKKSASVGKISQNAISWCNRYFEKEDPQVVGQNYDEYRRTLAENPRGSADDLIRDCCLSMKKQGLDVRLLTNDINLRNKTLMSGIAAISVQKLKSFLKVNSREKQDYLEGNSTGTERHEWGSSAGVPEEKPEKMVIATYLSVTPETVQSNEPSQKRLSRTYLSVTPETVQSNEPSQKRLSRRNSDRKSDGQVCHLNEDMWKDVEESISKTLGQILEVVFKETYEELWKQIIIHKPPWTLKEIFACWDKHWIAVFNDLFPREVKDLVKVLKDLLISARRSNIKSLVRNVELLYKFFEESPFKKYIHPYYHEVVDEASDCVMRETKTRVVVSPESKSNPSSEEEKRAGTTNAKEMINLVGVYITHFLAMIFDGCGVTHDLQRINSTQMAREDAHSSAVNLHTVIMKLGIAIVNCLSSPTSSSLQELGMLLVGFWNEAKEPCPALPFTEEDLLHIVSSPEDRNYLVMVVGELERLLTQLNTLMGS